MAPPRPLNRSPSPPKNANRPERQGGNGRPAPRRPSDGGTQTQDVGLAGKPPFTIVDYGPPGCGKTSKWAYLPDVGFLYDSQEEGIVDLVRFKQVPKPKWMYEASDWQDTENILASVANHEFGIKNLVVDSGTGFEKYCFQHHCREYFDDNWTKDGFFAFQQGPKNAAKTDWPMFLDWLDTVRKAGIGVVLILHSQVKSVNNPDGENYDQYMPYLDKETWAQTHRWAKAVIFSNIEVTLTKIGQKTKAKAGSEERCMYFDPGATFIAKNRWGMPTRIDAGGTPEESYNAFLNAYKKTG